MTREMRWRTSSVSPTPRSSISIAMPEGTSIALTSTGVCGGENDVALSRSSASRWMSGSAPGPITAASVTDWSFTRG